LTGWGSLVMMMMMVSLGVGASQPLKHLILHLNGNVNWQHAQQQLLLAVHT